MITDETLDDLRAKAQAAKAVAGGKWTLETPSVHGAAIRSGVPELTDISGRMQALTLADSWNADMWPDAMPFVAAANPTTILALVEEVERLNTMLEIERRLSEDRERIMAARHGEVVAERDGLAEELAAARRAIRGAYASVVYAQGSDFRWTMDHADAVSRAVGPLPVAKRNERTKGE